MLVEQAFSFVCDSDKIQFLSCSRPLATLCLGGSQVPLRAELNRDLRAFREYEWDIEWELYMNSLYRQEIEAVNEGLFSPGFADSD